MIQTFKIAVIAFVSLVVIVIGAPLLFWLGRQSQVSGELVVDDDLLADDPGVDVDGDE